MDRDGVTEGELEERGMNKCVEQVSHLALDIGGSLIKMVYFCGKNSGSEHQQGILSSKESCGLSNGNTNCSVLRGKLHFLKFETSKINECVEFMSSKQFHRNGEDCHGASVSEKNIIKVKFLVNIVDKILAKQFSLYHATGGGAFKFADLFKEKLGMTLDKVDEMNSLVAGANFLLKAASHEAYTYMDNQKEYVQIDQNDLYPYLLVNIGSGVSMIKVDGDGKFERVSGTSVGGGTFWGLGKLLTKCKSFDELLELSHSGNNRVIDMLVGDIYAGMDYSKIGLTSTAIASSFGKAVSEDKDLDEYKPEDVARSLLRMISNNIGQIAYLNALRFGLKRIFFGGFFIRGHAYTMDTISVAVNFWSNGEAKAMFLRHEGFLGALGAFTSYKKDGVADLMADHLVEQVPTKPSWYAGGGLNNSSILKDVNENISIECTMKLTN